MRNSGEAERGGLLTCGFGRELPRTGQLDGLVVAAAATVRHADVDGHRLGEEVRRREHRWPLLACAP